MFFFRMVLSTVFTYLTYIFSIIGELPISLMDSLENYDIMVEKGIGTVKFHEEEVSSGKIVQFGDRYVTIDGGIGSIYIDTQQ